MLTFSLQLEFEGPAKNHSVGHRKAVISSEKKGDTGTKGQSFGSRWGLCHTVRYFLLSQGMVMSGSLLSQGMVMSSSLPACIINRGDTYSA